MRLFICLACFFSFDALIAQSILPLQYDTSIINQEFILHGTADYGFSSIRNDFSNKILFGGFINDAIKDKSFGLHRGINRGGFEAGAELEYRNYKVNAFKKERGIVVKLGYGSFGSVLYSKDLFGLTFYGNESYLGQNVDFSGSTFNFMTFQKIGFGFIDKKSKSSLTLNAYSISNYASGRAYNGGLFQSESVDSINLLLDANLDLTNSSSFTKGIGLGFDFDYRIPFEIKKDKLAFLQMTVRNFGVAYFPTNVSNFQTDTTYIYEGFTLDQLVGNASVLNNGTSILDTLNVNEQTKSALKMLPGYVQVAKIIDEHNTSLFQSYFGAKLFYTLAYVPMIYIGGQLRVNDYIKFGSHFSYGGFTKFRMGLYANFDINKLNIGLGSEDFIGTVSKLGRGKSIQLRLRCAF
jgi:hypothetical protein